MDNPHHQMDDWMDKMEMIQGEIQDRVVELQRLQESRVNKHSSKVKVKKGHLVVPHRKTYCNKGEDSKTCISDPTG